MESGECALIVVKENNLSFIAVVKSECSPLLIVDFITQIISVFKTYIGTVNEVKIRGNFSIVYQARFLLAWVTIGSSMKSPTLAFR